MKKEITRRDFINGVSIAAASPSRSSLRPHARTTKFAAIRCRQSARPSPKEPPVTTASLSFASTIWASSP